MKNKVVAAILCIALMASLMTGCQPGTGNDETTKAPAKESTGAQDVESTGSETEAGTESKEIAVDHFAGTTIKVAVVKKANDTSTDWNQKEIFKLAEEATGIHVEWTVIDPSVSGDKIAVMLMSSEQPDVYLGALNESTLAANLDLFYDLSEEGLLETWAPNVVEIYNTSDYSWNALKWADGSIRSLLTGGLNKELGSYTAGTSVINMAWLEKTGKDIPTTADELYEVLVAFRDGDMDGDGDPTNEIPMSFCSGFWDGELMLYANAFGIGGNNTWQAVDHYKNIKDGKVVSTVDTVNYRAFLEFFHKLYAEGLLDTEGFSQTSDQYVTKRNGKNLGVAISSTTYLGEDAYMPFIYQGMEGVEPVLTGLVGGFAATRTNFCISAKSENVEAVLHWWNWLSKDAKTTSIAWGGSEFFYEEDGKLYQTNAKDLPEGYNAAIYGMHNYLPAYADGQRAIAHPDNKSSQVIIREEFTKEHLDLINKEGFPVAFGDAAKAEEKAFLEVELLAYIKTFTADAIVNGVTDASWEQHLKDLKAVQYYDWIQWYQDFVDEVNSR